jgi:hypothetical protein
MPGLLQKDIDTSKEVLIFAEKNYETAEKNYETYKNHYLSRNLKPISFEEFLKNYEV